METPPLTRLHLLLSDLRWSSGGGNKAEEQQPSAQRHSSVHPSTQLPPVLRVCGLEMQLSVPTPDQ